MDTFSFWSFYISQKIGKIADLCFFQNQMIWPILGCQSIIKMVVDSFKNIKSTLSHSNFTFF